MSGRRARIDTHNVASLHNFSLKLKPSPVYTKPEWALTQVGLSQSGAILVLRGSTVLKLIEQPTNGDLDSQCVDLAQRFPLENLDGD